jgi:hypothetical protein
MFYSCFDAKRGDYRLFEDSRSLAVNADLPVPSLGPDVSGIGVPAIEAGRPLPSGAQEVGRTWRARGIIVNCGAGLGAIDAETIEKWGPYVLIGGAALLIAYLTLRAGRNITERK